jgi:signal transduction histidine kinase
MGLFALSAFCGSFSAASQLGIISWLPWPLQGFLASVAFAWHVIFAIQFMFSFAGHEARWARLILLATALAIGLAFALAKPFYWTLVIAFLSLLIMIGLIFIARLLKEKQSLQVKLLFSGCLLAALAGLRDQFLFQIAEAGISDYSFMPHALFLYLVAMWWVLMQRSIDERAGSQLLTKNLELLAVEREQQLTSSFEQIQAQVAERAKLEERQRIMSDIHDGVGGQLVGLVNMIKRGESDRLLFDQAQLSEHAQMVLDELRIAVDAMQPVDGDLSTVLATLRYRLEPRLKASDIELIWQIDELPIMTELTPQKVLNIQRILFETFTNIIQHAKATTVTVCAKSVPETTAVKITIEDDGVGFAPRKLKSKGHGLRNMRNRAEAIGASITFQRLNEKGVTVTLTIPLV